MEVSIKVVSSFQKPSSNGIARECNIASMTCMMEREDEESVLPVVMEGCLEGASMESVLLLFIVKVSGAYHAHVYVREVSIVDRQFTAKNPPASVLRMAS